MMKESDANVFVEHVPGKKLPYLCISKDKDSKRYATFISEEKANEFINELFKIYECYENEIIDNNNKYENDAIDLIPAYARNKHDYDSCKTECSADFPYQNGWVCSVCGNHIFYKDNYCSRCGSKIRK